MVAKEKFGNILLLVFSLVIFFVLLEAFLAFFMPHKITAHSYQVENGEYHRVMGWVNKPGLDGEVKNRELVFHRRHNSKGLRSLREISYEKAAGVRRVLLLGDSFFWGYGVDDKDVFSEVLQQKVGPGTEIVNGSVIGYGTDQELLWLTEEGLKYKPDVIILGFYSFNDLDEISTSMSYGYPKPVCGLDGDKLALGNVPVPDTRETRRKRFNEPPTAFGKLKKFLRHHTHVYPFIAGRLNAVPSLRNLFISTGLAEENSRSLPGVPFYKINPGKQRELAEALIKSVRDISKQEAGADFLLVSIPNVETDPDNRLGYKGNIDWDKRYNENTGFSNYFREYAEKNNINFLDLLPVTRASQSKGAGLYNPYEFDHHWSAAGHRMAAEAIFEYLQNTGTVN